MKKWSLGILMLILGWASAVHAEGAYQMKSGETVFGRFGFRMGTQVCKLNKELGIINDCNRIKAGQWLKTPENVGGKAVTNKSVVKPVELACITLGAAPFNPEHNLKRAFEGIDLLTTLTPDQKELAKQKVALGDTATKDELVGQQIFKEMLYQSTKAKKEVKHVYGKPICSSEQGGQPEVMNTYDLGGGVFLSDPRRCGNPSVFVRPLRRETPLAIVLPEPQSQPKMTLPQINPTQPEQQEISPEEAVRRWDWELVVGQEHDRTAHSTFASGAIYGLFVNTPGAEHAFGIGGTYSGWHGKTDTGFGFNGQLSGVGPAYKYSAYEGGYDFGLKLLPWASLTENGEQAEYYKSRRHFDLNGITLSYNNGRREMMEEKFLFKHQLFVSAFKPTGGEAEHSVFNQPLPDANTKLDYVLNVGGRVGLYDFSKEDDKIGAKLWFAAGWFKEAPSLAETANWRIQLSDKHERLFLGIGRNYDLLNGGSLFGYGWSWDIRKTVYVHREETRRAQFVAAIEKAGGRLDKDGMIILPKGTKTPQKQFKTAPSDD
ncbi:MAG: hypothetical protein WA082_02390 [Candidatus Moraniibacteriota bacterium]